MENIYGKNRERNGTCVLNLLQAFRKQFPKGQTFTGGQFSTYIENNVGDEAGKIKVYNQIRTIKHFKHSFFETVDNQDNHFKLKDICYIDTAIVLIEICDFISKLEYIEGDLANKKTDLHKRISTLEKDQTESESVDIVEKEERLSTTLRKVSKIDQFDVFDPKGAANLGDNQFTRVEYDNDTCTWHRGWHKLNCIPNNNFSIQQLAALDKMFVQYQKDQGYEAS